MKAKRDQLQVFRRGKGDLRFGRQVVRRRVNFRIDHVAGNVQSRPLPLGHQTERLPKRLRQIAPAKRVRLLNCPPRKYFVFASPS
jgi:hypothetical protein